MREQFSVRKKLKILQQLEASEGSIRSFARKIGIDHALLLRWKKAKPILETAKKSQIKVGSGRRPAIKDAKTAVNDKKATAEDTTKL